ncbi:hypothetical protein AGMMS49925_08060 [Deltaproteobacteria bacterium]|nr:hypothetical protein AGMMS49925_08060 [Deltaproteobacteria bacterium]
MACLLANDPAFLRLFHFDIYDNTVYAAPYSHIVQSEAFICLQHALKNVNAFVVYAVRGRKELNRHVLFLNKFDCTNRLSAKFILQWVHF